MPQRKLHAPVSGPLPFWNPRLFFSLLSTEQLKLPIVLSAVHLCLTVWLSLQILKGVGMYGASTTYLLQRLKYSNLNPEVTTSKAAKSSIASTLAHDHAFVRIAHGHFALRAQVQVGQNAQGEKREKNLHSFLHQKGKKPRNSAPNSVF